MNQDQIQSADERMQKFFIKLLELKSFVKDVSDKSNNPEMQTVYEKLDQLIKEGQ